MNQSKMASIGEKQFVMKDSFEDLLDLGDGSTLYGAEERHFNIPWTMCIDRRDGRFFFDLFCTKDYDEDDDREWSIDATVTGKLTKRDGFDTFTRVIKYSEVVDNREMFSIEVDDLENYTIDGELPIEYHVKINKTTGIEMEKLRNFDDESAKKMSDVTLIVGGQKFYVNKMYLATHSAYFEGFFLWNFEESEESEIELKEINPDEFQKFLEVLYGEPAFDDYNFEGILKLADMFNAKTAIRQCEKFLVYESKESLKEKFALAIQYKMENLKTKLISELETVDDLRSIVPEDSDQFDTKLWKELFLKSLSYSS